MEAKVIEFLVKEGVINTDKEELYHYGLTLLIKKILHSMIILLIGLVGGEFWGVLFFLLAYSTIREYSGGYHAKTVRGCYFCTAVVTVFSLFLIKICPQPNNIFPWIFLWISVAIIWFFSPQEADSKPLEFHEICRYRKIARRYLIVFCGVSLGGFIYPSIFKGIVCALIIQAVMLLIEILGN